MPPTIAKTAKGQIEYRLEGSGPTVMVLNGGHCSRESRLSHEQLTAEGFSVLIPSRPGYDDTPSDVGRTAQQAADALAALLDTLQITMADVIGISAAPRRDERAVLERPVHISTALGKKKVGVPVEQYDGILGRRDG